jgi:hypothetical protein
VSPEESISLKSSKADPEECIDELCSETLGNKELVLEMRPQKEE